MDVEKTLEFWAVLASCSTGFFTILYFAGLMADFWTEASLWPSFLPLVGGTFIGAGMTRLWIVLNFAVMPSIVVLVWFSSRKHGMSR